MRTSKLHAVLAAIAVVGIACPGPDDMTAPVTEWESDLSGANEIPAVTSPGSATADFSLNAAGDSLNYTITIGTALDSAVTQAHIHTGAPNANGAIAIWLCESATNQAPAGDPAPTCATGETNGQVLATGRAAITAAQLNTLRAYGFYANIHTLKFTGGEIRGQVRNVGTAP